MSYVQKSNMDVLVQKKSKVKKKKNVDGASRTSETIFSSTALRHLMLEQCSYIWQVVFFRNLKHIAGSPRAVEQ